MAELRWCICRSGIGGEGGDHDMAERARLSIGCINTIGMREDVQEMLSCGVAARARVSLRPRPSAYESAATEGRIEVMWLQKQDFDVTSINRTQVQQSLSIGRFIRMDWRS